MMNRITTRPEPAMSPGLGRDSRPGGTGHDLNVKHVASPKTISHHLAVEPIGLVASRGDDGAEFQQGELTLPGAVDREVRSALPLNRSAVHSQIPYADRTAYGHRKDIGVDDVRVDPD